MVFVHCRYEVDLAVGVENGEVHITILPPLNRATPKQSRLHPYDIRARLPATTGCNSPVSVAAHSPAKPEPSPKATGLPSLAKGAPRKRKRPSKQKRNKQAQLAAPPCHVSASLAKEPSTTHLPPVCCTPVSHRTETASLKTLCENYFACDPTYNAVVDEIAAKLATQPPAATMDELVPMAVPTLLCTTLPTSGPPYLPIGGTGLSMVDVDPTELKDFIHTCDKAGTTPHKLTQAQRDYLFECWDGTIKTGSLTTVNSGTQDCAQSSTSDSNPTTSGCNLSPSVRSAVIPTVGKKKKK
eukprot:TRINITY_DN67970_c6_g1_i1.p1 TRINITY_DN67970_c6_g1~~TRINITY_DN67970_c6_g1_i1.p1  ORF type:complete len:298 (-),score=24.10 TRINITY_DN67970_c6_g1_i1:130-1023(-)